MTKSILLVGVGDKGQYWLVSFLQQALWEQDMMLK